MLTDLLGVEYGNALPVGAKLNIILRMTGRIHPAVLVRYVYNNSGQMLGDLVCKLNMKLLII